MRRARRACVASVVVAALAVAGGAAAVAPTSAIVSPRLVQDLALSGASVGYVADAPNRLACGQIGFWNPKTGTSFTVGAKEQCAEQTSTGQGIWDVSVATNRLLWVTYAGGNFREWSLWTATTTRREPRQLRFVSRPVESPPPIVLGPGKLAGIPYAVDRQIVYLGDNGRAIFKTTVQSPVRAVAAGPGRIRVAALLASGVVVGLDRYGQNVTTVDSFPRGSVTALRVSRQGIALQMGDEVHFADGVAELPHGASMLDVAQGRVLWMRTGDLGATTIATGESVRLVDGTPARPAHGQIESRGIAWSVGRAVRWRAGALP